MVVTGAAGFIASHVVDELLRRGHQVVAADRRSVGNDPLAAANLGGVVGHPRLVLHRVELGTAELSNLVAGADTVFHLAAVPGVRGSWGRAFGDYLTSNVLVTQRLLSACERAGVRRIVLASSSSVYGRSRGPSQESDPACPISPYGITKLAAEQLCLAHAGRPDTALTAVVLRYFTVYGPRQRPDMAIGRLLLAALSGTPVPLYGDGRQRREFTYVGDVVAATVDAAAVEPGNVVINVGGGQSVPVLGVLDLVREITGHRVPLIRMPEQPGDMATTEADLGRAHQLLGYRPQVGLRDGLVRHAAWLAGLSESARRAHLPEEAEIAR
jgi:nucleoside-diphosphate-sugar epimerase